MKYLSIIISATILFAENTDEKHDSKKINEQIAVPLNDIAYNSQYQQNRGGYNQYSNQTAYHLDQAGQHLKNFRSQYYTGFALTVGGQILMIAGADEGEGGTLVIGGGVAIVGALMSFLSNVQVGKAGEELEQASRAMQ